MQKILIVDDEENIRKVIREYLEFEGFLCFEASNGEEAIKMCKENSHVCYTLLISRKGEYVYAKRNKSKAKIIPSRTDHAGKYR